MCLSSSRSGSVQLSITISVQICSWSHLLPIYMVTCFLQETGDLLEQVAYWASFPLFFSPQMLISLAGGSVFVLGLAATQIRTHTRTHTQTRTLPPCLGLVCCVLSFFFPLIPKRGLRKSSLFSVLAGILNPLPW